MYSFFNKDDWKEIANIKVGEGESEKN